MHFLLSKGTYKWDSVYSLNILCFCTPVCPSMIHSQANPGFRGKDCPPPFFFFFWHGPALGGCLASGGRHMATVLLWGSTSDHYQAMTHHLARGYGQKITEAIFLGNSFYLLIRLVKHVAFIPDPAYTFGKPELFKFGHFVNSKLRGLGKRKFTGHLVER